MKVVTRMFSRAVACALLTGVAGAAPTQADTLTVTAKGAIAPSCAVSNTQNFPTSNFTAAGTAAAKASISCNQFFKVTTTSAKGAFKTNAPAVGSFGNSLPYTLKADVALDDGSTRTASGASSTLLAGQSSCQLSPANSTGLTSNGQVATNKTTTLTASWSAALLVPGSYSDTITFTVAVVP